MTPFAATVGALMPADPEGRAGAFDTDGRRRTVTRVDGDVIGHRQDDVAQRVCIARLKPQERPSMAPANRTSPLKSDRVWNTTEPGVWPGCAALPMAMPAIELSTIG